MERQPTCWQTWTQPSSWSKPPRQQADFPRLLAKQQYPTIYACFLSNGGIWSGLYLTEWGGRMTWPNMSAHSCHKNRPFSLSNCADFPRFAPLSALRGKDNGASLFRRTQAFAWLIILCPVRVSASAPCNKKGAQRRRPEENVRPNKTPTAATVGKTNRDHSRGRASKLMNHSIPHFSKGYKAAQSSIDVVLSRGGAG
jgi:hypothetical protein